MPSLQKRYSSVDDFNAEFEAIMSSGGMLLESQQAVEARAVVSIELIVDEKALGRVEGEVVYATPAGEGQQLGIELRGEWRESLTKMQEALATDEGTKWGKDKESLYHRVQELTSHEKIQLALKGGLEERRILLKEGHQMVHSYVLKNPRIQIDEVSKIAKRPQISSEMILTISKNTEWMQNAAIRLAIVRNPKTPANIVQKHIGRLRDQDLLLIAKSDHVRDVVSRIAKRTLASRGKAVR